MSIRVTVWNEGRHEKKSKAISAVYPGGIHAAIAGFLSPNKNFEVRTAVLDDPDCGLPDEVLNTTDVLIWWGHMSHDDVPDELATKVQEAVLKGMGLIVLHSGHYSKPFKKLMGTSCSLKWREGDRERLWCVDPGHPIAKGLPEHFELEHEEMYGEFFDVPKPDETVFISWFPGGEVFRSGITYHRGYGKVFYFRPGHEEYPTFFNENVQKVLTNAVEWAAPLNRREIIDAPNTQPLEASL
jgi:trehalose utilization protein